MKIPGVPLKHTVITPQCRVAQGGDMEALEEAYSRVERAYRHHVENADEGLLDRQNLRLVLLVETDRE